MTAIPYVYEPAEVRELLPFEWAASCLGIHFGLDDRALCPFHDDRENPNFELMPPGSDGVEWAYCRACGKAVDAIGLVRAVRNVDFGAALRIASEFILSAPTDFERRPVSRRRAYAVTPEWEARLQECTARAIQHRGSGLLGYAYGFRVDSEALQAFDQHLIDWGWGLAEDASVVIPHRDPSGDLTGVKVRGRDRSWKAYGTFPRLYGEWRIPPRHYGTLLLCEGESDAAAASFNQHDIDVLALPTGVSTPPREGWIELAQRYTVVYLALDSEPVSYDATARWLAELSPLPTAHLPIPDGQDLRDALQDYPLAELVERAGTIHP